jgi:hypothetical protein
MAGEFTKSTAIVPAVVGTVANPDEYNQNIAGQSKDAIVAIDADGNFIDGDIGDETLGANGTLVTNLKLREGGNLKFYNASGVFQNNVNLGQATNSLLGQTLLPDQITISNGTDVDHDIDFTAGNFNFDDGSGQAVATALTKQIDASWVAGDNAGGLDTGTVAADTFYYCYVIHNPTTGVSDAIFTATYNSPTLPTGYTKKAYRGAILTDGSGNIRSFIRRGNTFIFDLPVINYNPAPTSGVFAPYTMTVPKKPNIIGWLEAESSYTGTAVVSLNSKWRVTGSGFGGIIHSGGAINRYTGRRSDFYAIMDSNGAYEHAWDFVAPNGPFYLLVVGWIDKDL